MRINLHKEKKANKLRTAGGITMPSTCSMTNPGCGWYHIYTFALEQEIDFEQLKWCMHEEESLALVIINIGAYRDCRISGSGLRRMDRVLEYFSDMGKDMILRITYDTEGRGMEHEPSLFTRILEHVDQIGPFLQKHADAIYVFQGLLVGSWGEMHSSKFLAKDRLCAIAEAIRKYLGVHTYLAVRKPSQYRQLYPALSPVYQTGVFDDAIFGSRTHLGTFGEASKHSAGWEASWNAREEYCFLQELGASAPCGGELLLDESGSHPLSLEETVEILRQMRISYLNASYDERLLHVLEQMRWKSDGIWKGMSGREYIGRHLGYRFIVTNVLRKKDSLLFTVQNDGFAPCCFDTCMKICIIKPETEKKELENLLEIQVEGSLKHLMPQNQQHFSVDLPKEEMAMLLGADLFLQILRSYDQRVIYLANDSKESDRLFLGRMSQQEEL